jgi:hypothetical protein
MRGGLPSFIRRAQDKYQGKGLYGLSMDSNEDNSNEAMFRLINRVVEGLPEFELDLDNDQIRRELMIDTLMEFLQEKMKDIPPPTNDAEAHTIFIVLLKKIYYSKTELTSLTSMCRKALLSNMTPNQQMEYMKQNTLGGFQNPKRRKTRKHTRKK